ncbi:LysE family translocator [Pelosinus sp. sgz500959]|uniref:LysE family translocator n=1 Tax=Pelosinus sp. sgz500959 TaxID=3242472 RepID=UPI003670CAB7
MNYILLIKCIISGFLLAAPIGPVNLICIRYTLSGGRVPGLIVGMGAALADALYGSAAAAGLSVLTAFIRHYNVAFRWGGGLFIIYLGFATFCATLQNTSDDKNTGRNLYNLFAGVFLLTLTNPVTIFTFIAIFSSFGIAMLVTDLFTTVLATLGVFIGSALWWITLTSIVCLFRNRVTPRVIVRINKIAGIIIILLGVASIVGL